MSKKKENIQRHVFDRSVYTLQRTTKTKREAEKLAKELRWMMYDVRVIKHTNGHWHVWAHGQKKVGRFARWYADMARRMAPPRGGEHNT